MKKITILFLLTLSAVTFGQSKIATTEDGKRVLLKDNNTWEYIDSASKSQQENIDTKCILAKDYKEPNSKWRERLRKHVAIENDCELTDVKFLKITEAIGNGMYSVCVKGKEMKYRMIGSVFLRADQDPFPKR